MSPSATTGPCAVNCTNANEIYGFHTGGANLLFADGSVRMAPANTSVNVIIPLTTRAVGDAVSIDF